MTPTGARPPPPPGPARRRPLFKAFALRRPANLTTAVGRHLATTVSRKWRWMLATGKSTLPLTTGRGTTAGKKRPLARGGAGRQGRRRAASSPGGFLHDLYDVQGLGRLPTRFPHYVFDAYDKVMFADNVLLVGLWEQCRLQQLVPN